MEKLPMRRRAVRSRSAVTSLIWMFLLVGALVLMQPVSSALAFANPAPVLLGSAGAFTVLGASTVTNTGPTVVSADAGIGGNLGVSPGTAVTGFPPGLVSPPGVINAGDATAATAQTDAGTGYNDAAARAPDVVFAPVYDLGGQTFTTGVYNDPSSLAVTGTVTLDGEGNPDAVFIFQAGSTLVTSALSSVLLTNGANACNVFWQVGSSATLGATSSFNGTILALTSITVGDGVDLEGRALAGNGAVTLSNDIIHTPDCAPPPAASIGITKLADQHHVSPPQPDGFMITVTSGGPADALDVTIDDPLPMETGFVWSIDGGTGAASCSIVANDLQCSFGPMAAGTSETVHISTPTSDLFMGKVWNTATVNTSNAGSAQATDFFKVACTAIGIAIAPDASPALAGSTIGFTITATATDGGTDRDVTVTAPLQTGRGLSWTIDQAGSSPGCSIDNATLTCNWGSLKGRNSLSVHITSPTLVGGDVRLRATASASNVLMPRSRYAVITVT